MTQTSLSEQISNELKRIDGFEKPISEFNRGYRACLIDVKIYLKASEKERSSDADVPF